MGWMVSFDSIWTASEDDDANIGWSRSMWTRLAEFGAGDRIYLNFPGQGEEGEALLRSSVGAANYARLQAVKRRYDPDNVFRFNQNITP